MFRYMKRKSEFGRNGYAPSIMQLDTSYCYLCGRTDRKLDRHELFFGPYRTKSKNDGLWVMLCHFPCHEGKDGAQYNREIRNRLSAEGQRMAMAVYGWTTEAFIARYGKNWL